MLLVSEKERLLLRGTDNELTIKTVVEVREAEPGMAAVPAETLLSLVKVLSGDTVTCTLEDGESLLLLKCGRSNYKVPVLPPKDYLPEPLVEHVSGFAIEGDVLSNALGRVLSACATDDTRPAISGVRWEVEGSTLRLIATDTHRLHVNSVPVTEVSGKQVFTLSRRASGELSKIPTRATCMVTVGNNTVEVCSDWWEFNARLTEGEFPKWQRIVPTDEDSCLLINREELLAAARRAGIVAEGNVNRLKLSLTEDGALSLTARSADRGEADESVRISSMKGDIEKMAVNYRFLVDALQAIPDEYVHVNTTSSSKPVLIHGDDRVSFFSVVMPMQLETGRP